MEIKFSLLRLEYNKYLILINVISTIRQFEKVPPVSGLESASISNIKFHNGSGGKKNVEIYHALNDSCSLSHLIRLDANHNTI